jgi:hypothetical protein
MRFAAGTAAGLVAEGLMGTDGVVDLFPVAELAIELFHFQRARCDVVELFGVAAVGALNGAGNRIPNDRERRVIALVGQGLKNSEVAEKSPLLKRR